MPYLSEWQIEQMERELGEKLNAWRIGLTVKKPETFRGELAVRPFKNPEQRPALPDVAGAEATCKANAATAVMRENSNKGTKPLAWFVGITVTLITTPVLAIFGLFVGIASGVLFSKIRTGRWHKRVEALAFERARSAWDLKCAEMQADYEAEVSAFMKRESRASTVWLASERTRVTLLERVLNIEHEAIEEAVAASVATVTHRLGAKCSVALDDEDHALVDIDLPEIDDCVPEVQYKLLKNGTTKEAKRKISERNQAYSEFVCGIALAVGASALSAAPTLTHVTVAGRTERQKRDSVEVEDTYVLEVKIPRVLFSGLHAASVDPVGVLEHLPSRIERSSNGSLKRITPPGWTANVQRKAAG